MATIASAIRSSFVSPPAEAGHHVGPTQQLGSVSSQLLANITWWQALITLVLGAVLYDQVSYLWQKGSISGPSFKLPFVGPFIDAIYPKFWKYKVQWASGDLSCVSIFHKFVIIASSRDMSRKVFNSPSYVKPCLVDVAAQLLRPDSWVFLDGKEHVEYRKGLNPLFNRQALELYVNEQESVFDDYFAHFVRKTQAAGGQPTPFMPMFREFMCANSLRVFAGHYMPASSVQKIADNYYKVTAALDLVNFPVILPFTRPWYGKSAADMVMHEFAKCAAMSKAKMRSGGTPTCILDTWVANMYASQEYTRKTEAGETVPPEEKPAHVLRMFNDWEIALTIFTFLFASQDATSSACTWLFQIMADRPELLDKVREENLAARGGDRHQRCTLEMVENLPYTRAVVKETLRYRPPVIMVPYTVKQPFPLSPTYTAPKGAMLAPSCWPALHDPEVYPQPDEFDPDRWITGTAEAQQKNWLVFGTGPHYCLGQTYATNMLIAMIGKASMHVDWTHKVTNLSEEVKVFATIFPMDDCLLSFSKRE